MSISTTTATPSHRHPIPPPTLHVLPPPIRDPLEHHLPQRQQHLVPGLQVVLHVLQAVDPGVADLDHLERGPVRAPQHAEQFSWQRDGAVGDAQAAQAAARAGRRHVEGERVVWAAARLGVRQVQGGEVGEGGVEGWEVQVLGGVCLFSVRSASLCMLECRKKNVRDVGTRCPKV